MSIKRRILFLIVLAVTMFIAWHTYIIERAVYFANLQRFIIQRLNITCVGGTVGYWLQYVIIAILLFRKK